MPCVYVLRDQAGRCYIGATADLPTRLAQHARGGTQTTRNMSGPLELAASREYATMQEALEAERAFKRWKNSAKVIAYLKG